MWNLRLSAPAQVLGPRSAHHHADTSADRKLSPSNLVQDEDDDASADQLADVDHPGQNDSILLALPKGLEQGRGVVDESVDARELFGMMSVESTSIEIEEPRDHTCWKNMIPIATMVRLR